MSAQPAHRHVWSGLGTESEGAPVGILGIPFDGAVSFRPGAAHAPERLRMFSSHVTPITEEGYGLRQGMIRDYGNVERDLDWARYFDAVTAAALEPLKHPFTLFLGGDHSVTIPLHRAFSQAMGKSFGILHIDAHPDLCDTFEGHKWSHACTERRALELPNLKPEHLVFCGIRSWEQQELDLLAQNPGIGVHSARRIHQRGIEAIAAAVVDQLASCDAIYLTLDIDCLDPAFAPGTGTPEAGGLTSRQLLEFLRIIFEKLPIRAMDIVEVSPPLDYSDITTVAALKVIYEVLGWVQARGNR
jgi:agmatinase